MSEVRLTSLAHGGGCGCKLSSAVLADILRRTPAASAFADLIVGTETGDDAAVWRLDEHRALVATTDFFTPIVDDPFDYGRIAAANALSDVWAMGGRPIFALAIVGMPIAALSPETIARILAGGADSCAGAGVPIAGGHSIDAAEPIYGLAAIGLVELTQLKTNRGGRAGDTLILTKPLGVGVLSAALRQGRLDGEGYAALMAVAGRLNAVGAEIATLPGVHAMTDVTGFGLAGHALEMARGAGLEIELFARAPALIPEAEALVRAGVVTGASRRNLESAAPWASWAESLEAWRRDLITDPQTNGGLLVAAEPAAAGEVLALLEARGFAGARPVGRLRAGQPGLVVRDGAFPAS